MPWQPTHIAVLWRWASSASPAGAGCCACAACAPKIIAAPSDALRKRRAISQRPWILSKAPPRLNRLVHAYLEALRGEDGVPVRGSASAAAVAAILLVACSKSFAAPADELRALLEQGRSADAYALGRSHSEELGKPDFDFYYGIAALDSGHAGEGVLALERYVVRFPDNDRARLELARGYFVLGELVRAREEFEIVLRKDPPPAVQATIERFMDSIRAQETRYATTAIGYVEIGGGYDSNVNSGIGNPVISVPTLGTVQLAQAGVKSGSSFLHLGAGGSMSHPVAPGVALLGGANAEFKLNAGSFDKQFDQGAVAAYGGVSVIRDKDLYRATFSPSTLEGDYNRFRDTASVGGEWHRQVDELNTGSVFLQYARLQYPSSPARDADFYGFDAGVSYRLTRQLTLRGDYLHSDNRSNIELYKYTRDLISFRARYEF